MTVKLPISVRSLRAVMLLFLMLASHAVWSQCTNPSAFGTITAPTTNAVVTITTCAFGGEYSTINGCTAGSTYLFNATGGTGNYITIRQGSPGGTVLGFGFAPISVVCTASGPLYLHYNTNAACGTDGSCHTGTIQCTSCVGAADPCSTILTQSCGTSSTATLSGSGLWSPGSCGFSTPGQEKVYSFTAPSTGVYSLQVTSTSSTGYIDYFYKAASAGCSSTGWTCILDIFSPTTASMGTLTGGTTYYILLDAETTTSITQTFQINCPVYNPCASTPTLLCATPVTATATGTGVWSPASCGFSTPGQEKVYSFTASVTGIHTQVVTAASGGYGDYFYKAASGGCSATGWTCIGDANAPESNSFGPLTAGTTYYILFDPEVTTATSQTFRIDCPPAGSAPACLAAPASPANGSNAGCPNTTQTLSWPAAPTATSYDVYFGTSTTPPFFATVAGTSINTGILAAGTYYWQIRPLNAQGTASGCTIWSFTKTDVIPPSISCPASVTINNSPATACSAVVTYGAISATDNCTAPSITLVGGLASGSTFPVGVTIITYRATDAVGLSSTCTFTVTVNDVTLPNITCPANIVKSNDPGLCGATTTYTTPVATDNCSVTSVVSTGGLASGAFYPVGVTTNVWRATDASGNTRTCSFTVTVNDTQAPSITCPANLSLNNDWNNCSRTVDYLGGVFLNDNCGIGSLTNNSPGTFPIGTTTVTYIVKDLTGNSSTCTQTVKVTDYQPPTVICPANIVTLTDENSCSAVVDYVASFSDNCPGFTASYTQEPLSSFELGYTNVTASVIDAAGLSTNCTFQIVVKSRLEVCNGLDDDCDGLVDEVEDWQAVAKRYASDGAALEQFGQSVDIDGDWAIVGSNHTNGGGQGIGAAYLLHRNAGGSGNWGEVSSLVPASIQNSDLYGGSVAISNGIAAVGAAGAGAVYIFQQNATNLNQWEFVKKLLPSDQAPGSQFGTSISLYDGLLVVGAPLDDEIGNEAGAAYLFDRNLGGQDNWGQAAKLKATDGEAFDHLGGKVSIHGTRALVGATGDDDKGDGAGAAYIFEQDFGGAGAWGQAAKLRAKQGKTGDNFGISVGLSGSYALIGADGNDLKASNAGAAFIYRRTPTGSWLQETTILEYNGSANDHFGAAVALDGNYATVGAPGDNPFGLNSGRAFAYLRQELGWVLVGQLADGGGAANDALGNALAISGQSIIAGIPQDKVGIKLQQGSIIIFEGNCAGVQFREDLKPVALGQDFNLRCYPVPFSDALTIELQAVAADVRISIMNTLGQIVHQVYQGALDGEGTFRLQTGDMQPGIYLLRVQAGDQVKTQTILLAR